MLSAVLAFSIALGSDPALQEPPAAVCSPCKSRGSRPCPGHGKAELELEAKVQHCANAAKCKRCLGTLEIDCDQCTLGDERTRRAVDQKKKWLESLKPHFALLGRDLLVARSPHFELTWEGGKAVVGKSSIGEHAAVHLYLDRCEAVHAEFKDTFGAHDGDFSTLFKVMVWDRYKDHQMAATEYCGQTRPNTGVKRQGAVGIYSVFLDPDEVDPDENAGADLHRNIRHNVAHLLLANAWNQQWPGDNQGGWIDEGVSHWFEDRMDKRCINFCYREQDTTQRYKDGRWRGPVKALANDPKRPSFAETAAKRTDELTVEEHALAWSYCEFLIHVNGKGFGKLAREVKAGRSYRDLLKSEFGWNPLEFEEAWRKHVRGYGK